MNTRASKHRFPLPAALATALLISGCAAQERSMAPVMPMTPPPQFTEPEQRHANPGSLFNVAENTSLYADNRARRVGDIVLIKVVENAKSKSTADTTATRERGSSLQVAAAFNRRTVGAIPGVIPGVGGSLSGTVGMDPILATQSRSSLNATGETTRENYVTATIGARVLNVLPGGVLQVQGARAVRVNEETQYMVISGLVRAQDVRMDNSVESTQLADSRIEYFGEGVLADKQKQGWLTRLLNNIWPF